MLYPVVAPYSPPTPPFPFRPPWPDRDSTGPLKTTLPLLPPCPRVWKHCLSLAQMVPPVSKMGPPRLSPPPSEPLCPSPLLEWLGLPHRGVEFNKGSLSHMLKRYANVQVLLFSDVPPPSTRPSSNWLLFSPSQSQTHGGRVCVWERERVWVFVFQRNGLFC